MTDISFIRQLWSEVADEYPDKSTEFLLQIICDRYQISTGQEIDHSDVAGALVPKGASNDK